ncbi:unnamed protein product [Prunus brigantina]
MVADGISEFVFDADGGSKEGLVAGEKRARTWEMLDVGGLDSDELSPSLPPISMSFKDKVSGDFRMAEDKFEISDDNVVIKHGAIPSIEFSERVKDCLYMPGRTAVIIKLMGRPLSKIRGMLIGGPWQITGQYIVTQNWKPGFNAKEDRVDAHTMGQARGKFARLCVELDLSKPLILFIEVEGHTYGVVYEGIQLVCFECGCFGHDTPPAPNEDVVVVNPANFVAEIPTKMHGQWMLMKPKTFRKKVPHEQGQLFSSTKKADKASGVKIVASQSGSRFNYLRDGDGRDNEDASFTPGPFGFKKASKPAAQAHERASLCLSVLGNKLAQCVMFLLGVGKKRFSFNMDGPFFSKSCLGKDRLLHGHEPPDIVPRVLNEAFFSGVSLTSDHMDHHGDLVD